MKCRVCKNEIENFMTFGKMPIANAFLNSSEFNNEFFFNLAPSFCHECFTLQLTDQPKPETMFHDNYTFFSRTSKYMVQHFKELAEMISKNYLNNIKDPFIIEIGSNDGVFLENFVKKNINHLGIEPSSNVAKVAEKYGVKSMIDFINKDTAEEILQQYGKANVISAANVICHIPDINQVAESISMLLKKNGVFIFEDPYLGSMIEKISYDQLYDEHVYIFSAMSVQNIFLNYNLELIDVIPQKTHGGSMRYILSKKGEYKVSSNVEDIINKEKILGLNNYNTFINFKKNVEESKNNLINLLHLLKNKGKKVVGYAATSKSTTVLNYCNIETDLISCIFDTTPEKINKYSPGKHLPIYAYDDFNNHKIDYAYLFAWNHFNEINTKENKFISNGGKWIMHVPKVRISP